MASSQPRRRALVAAVVVGLLGLANAGAQDGLPPAPAGCADPVPGEVCREVDAAAAGAQHNLEVAQGLAAGAVAGTVAGAQAQLAALPCEAPVYVWTSATDGSGSCLDSDTLDGLDSAQLLRSDVSGTLEGSLQVAGQLVAGFEGGGMHLVVNDCPDARWGLATGGFELTLWNDADWILDCQGGGAWAPKAAFTPGGGLRLGGPLTSGPAVIGPPGGGRHLVVNDCPDARWGLATGAYELAFQSDFDGVANCAGGGQWATKVRFTPHGDVIATGHVFAHSGAHVGDVAEPVLGEGLAPGDVVVMDGFDPQGKLRVRKAGEARSREVAGVVSADPSLRLAGLATDTPLAVTGIVAVKVAGPVARGDLLASSAVPGHAMACLDAAACYGAVLGKALEAHAGPGAGAVRALVTLG